MKDVKRCYICKQYLTKDNFYTDNSKPDFCCSSCKECQRKENQTERRKLIKKTSANKHREEHNISQVNKYKTSMTSFLDRKFSVSLLAALRRNRTGYEWELVVPYTLDELKSYVESMFTPEMNWSNRGTIWELTHIIPLRKFKFSTFQDRDFQIYWSLYNLKPMLYKESRLRYDEDKFPQSVYDNIAQKAILKAKNYII